MVVNIAKNIITLSAINDAFSVSFSPSTCVIKADYDGNNPLLNSAYTDVSLKRGEKKAKYELTYKTSSNSGIAYKISTIDEYTKRILLTAIPNNVVSGYLIFDIESDEGYNSTITFQFSVIRESTMLDWIQDWENNKTTIGSTYLIAPKIFVGKKVVNEAGLNSLTGVYIGPDDNSAGIYGYKAGQDIFHINESGGSIGGWDINNGGIQTEDGLFKILSEGTIKVLDEKEELIWGIQKTGDAVFSRGKVRFERDGSAFFEGSITSGEGKIGGWIIGQSLLYSDYLILDSSKHYIGISPFKLSTLDSIDNTFNHKTYVEEKGGVCMFYTSANSYGIGGYLPAKTSEGEPAEIRQVFSLGSANYIAGWSMSEKRLSSTHIALVSDNSASGIYMSTDDIGQITSSNLAEVIDKSSGIYLYGTEHEAKLVGMKESGVVFSLSSATDSIIAGWKFNDTAIFKGSLMTSGFTQSSGDITISSEGLRGHKWRFDADGYGAIAGGDIYWDKMGVHFGENVKLSWNNFSDKAKEDMQDVLLPDWVNDWDKMENKTEIGGEYIVSPKIFSGTKDLTSGKLTGIAIGRDCITIDGQKRTGIFAVNNDNIMLELDPINKKYRFSGTILAKVSESNVWEVDENCINYIGNKDGEHIELNPSSKNLCIYDENGANVTILEGKKYNSISEMLPISIPDINVALPLPFSVTCNYEEYSKVDEIAITDLFYTDTAISVACPHSGMLSKTGIFSSCRYSLYIETYSDAMGKVFLDSTLISGKGISGNVLSLQTGYDSSDIVKQIPAGYHKAVIQYSLSAYSSESSTFTLMSFSVDIKMDSYISKYFGNGFILGTGYKNLISFMDVEDTTTSPAKKNISMIARNEKYGIEFNDKNLYSYRDTKKGMISSVLCCGRVMLVEKEPKLVQYVSVNGDKPTLIKRAVGFYILNCPTSWGNIPPSAGDAYLVITGGTNAIDPNTGALLSGRVVQASGAVGSNNLEIYVSINSTPCDGEFYFEIKWY